MIKKVLGLLPSTFHQRQDELINSTYTRHPVILSQSVGVGASTYCCRHPLLVQMDRTSDRMAVRDFSSSSILFSLIF